MTKNDILLVQTALGLDKNHSVTVSYGDRDEMVTCKLFNSSNEKLLTIRTMQRGVWLANILNYTKKLDYESVTLK